MQFLVVSTIWLLLVTSKKKGLSEKESAGENFNFISFGFSKFMLLIVMFVRNSTELPF